MYEEMQRWMQQIVSASKLMDYRIGTVLRTSPVILDIGDGKKITDVGGNIIYTEAVIRKTLRLRHKHDIITLSHNHEVPGTETNTTSSHAHSISSRHTKNALEGCYESEDTLDEIVITEGIQGGDQVLLLRVAAGQKWIVLSKLREANAVQIDAGTGTWEWK